MKKELLAPNGKPSNLTPEQYKLVRTDAFKNFFGNWENDPKNSSKVVDENGEPLVCYHGTQNKEFTIFDRSKINSQTQTDTSNIGFWFTSSLWEAEGFAYGFDESERVEGVGRVISGFINIKKPLNVIDFTKQIKAKFNPKEDVAGMYIEEHQLKIKEIFNSNDFDGIVLDNIFIIQNSNQIKLADGTNTTFDSSNDDIRFEQGGEINEEAQQLIDIISMNPKLEKYQKYKVLLKDKFRIDFDSIYKDQEYIDGATLNDIKSKDDFFDFGNWLQYAKIISKKRGFVPMDLYFRGYDEITDETWSETAKKLDFTVQKVEYEERGTGSGDIAQAFGDTIVYTKEADLYYFLHEIGHIYDFQNVLTGIIKNPAYSPTNYGTTHSGETFAENFAIYFLNPIALKNWNEDVYYSMDSAINDKYKKELKKIVSEKSKYEKGGSLLLAPNGKPSNLTPEQYKLVRTDAFKSWFGNWENDPKNASKVVDENGEPLVVYHSSNSNFNTFKFNTGKGIYSSYSSFTENKRLSESYGNIIYEVFLKIQKPYIINGDGQYIWKVIDKKNSPDLFFDENVLPSFDGIMFKNVIDFNGKLGSKFILDVSNIYMVRKNTQIKLADRTNTTFDSSNDDIRFEQGGETKYTTPDYLVMFLGK